MPGETCFLPIKCSGQIITTSAEVTLNGGLIRELPQNPLNSGLGIILICPDKMFQVSPLALAKYCNALLKTEAGKISRVPLKRMVFRSAAFP